MLTTLRTHRVLSATVALTLLAGVTLPLARYVCAMTMRSITMPSMPMVSTCSDHDAQQARHMRGCRGPTGHLCPTDGSCPHAADCRAATHAADVDECCGYEVIRAEQAPKVDVRQAFGVVLPLIAVVDHGHVTLPTHRSFADPVVSRSAGGGVPPHLLYGSLLL